MSANFNTDSQLWFNLRKAELGKPTGNRVAIKIIDGHAFQGQECIARFTDGLHAHNTLAAVGWRSDQTSSERLYRAE